MYVYKLNEDIILYKHSSENNQSSSHTAGFFAAQTWSS